MVERAVQSVLRDCAPQRSSWGTRKLNLTYQVTVPDDTMITMSIADWIEGHEPAMNPS